MKTVIEIIDAMDRHGCKYLGREFQNGGWFFRFASHDGLHPDTAADRAYNFIMEIFNVDIKSTTYRYNYYAKPHEVPPNFEEEYKFYRELKP